MSISDFQFWGNFGGDRDVRLGARGTGDGGRHIWRPYMVSGCIFGRICRAAIYRGRGAEGNAVGSKRK